MSDKKKTHAKHPTGARQELRDSAEKIWLAGLGALAVAEQEGSKLFRNLVKKGEELEARGKEQVEKLRVDVDDQVDKVRTRAGQTWDRLEETVDEKIASALHRLGVPSKDEIHRLTRRVEELNASVERLRPKAAKHAPAPARKAAHKNA
jgi:poly(hydroxyalkanoate) granule-associated protein